MTDETIEQMHIKEANLVAMIGTDHGLASVDVRSAFVLDKEKRAQAMKDMRNFLGATGVTLITTCNRTELWASFDGVEMPERHVSEDGHPEANDPFLIALCQAHGLKPEDYANYFVCRNNGESISHLFNMTCGLRSAIVAEDQIISQVKHAIGYSREHGLTDGCLEVLFREAVAAAKNVKSGVRFTRAYATAVEQAMHVLQEKGVDLANTTCMVIGNGEYGRLAATTLVEAGARVFVTVRQYSHGQVSIPAGCGSIPYADRYLQLPQCDIVMSATTSPHYTLSHDEFTEHNVGNTLLFDLAIPRDIDPAIATIEGCEIFDIDSFSTEVGAENAQAIAEAQTILDAGIDEFWNWVQRRRKAQAMPDRGMFFPLFVNLNDKRVVFVGGGTVALRRLRTILPFVNNVEVIAPEVTPEVQAMADEGAVTLRKEAFTPGCLDGADMVFACTNDDELNARIADDCHEAGRLVSVSSNRHLCDFYFPGVVQYENMVVGISAAGRDHRRVRQLRKRIERLLEEEDL